MLKNAGITAEHTVLAINGINPALCLIGACLGARMTDVIGRRPILLYSIIFSSVCFAIITGTSKLSLDDPSNHATGNATVAFIFIFGIVFSSVFFLKFLLEFLICSAPFQLTVSDSSF